MQRSASPQLSRCACSLPVPTWPMLYDAVTVPQPVPITRGQLVPVAVVGLVSADLDNPDTMAVAIRGERGPQFGDVAHELVGRAERRHHAGEVDARRSAEQPVELDRVVVAGLGEEREDAAAVVV